MPHGTKNGLVSELVEVKNFKMSRASQNSDKIKIDLNLDLALSQLILLNIKYPIVPIKGIPHQLKSGTRYYIVLIVA